MTKNNLTENAITLASELQWLNEIITTRICLYFKSDCEYNSIHDIPPPHLDNDTSYYAAIIKHYEMNFEERLILILSLAPHIQPQSLDLFLINNENYNRSFTEFGGKTGTNHSGFIPTGQTAVFILAENNLETRFKVSQIFNTDHFFRKNNILELVDSESNEPFLSGVLIINKNYLNSFISDAIVKSDYSIDFLAKRITTELEWSDLILDENTLKEVSEIIDWIQHGTTLLNDWGMKGKFKPGFKALFYGPPGTGKTLTASLIGKSTGRDVYKMDLSMVVSKFIGETEKNLKNIFDQAQDKNWILFLDEADAMFGKRTQIRSSNDRQANREVSYLLQCIEDFPGVVILATNLKSNIDDAFSRHFQSMIYFGMPDAAQRKKIWSNSFSEIAVLEESINLAEISEKYDLFENEINTIIRFVSIKAIKSGQNTIRLIDVMNGIKRELSKRGITELS